MRCKRRQNDITPFSLSGAFLSLEKKQAARIWRPDLIRGANERIRTADLRITSALLYQLSHVGIRLLSEARVSSISEPFPSRKGVPANFACILPGIFENYQTSSPIWCEGVRRRVPKLGDGNGLRGEGRVNQQEGSAWERT